MIVFALCVGLYNLQFIDLIGHEVEPPEVLRLNTIQGTQYRQSATLELKMILTDGDEIEDVEGLAGARFAEHTGEIDVIVTIHSKRFV